jgi:2-polyprenyl-3-methyl-5-hydroxy-6-metoxy-1,4-benzoquinol methylase/septal ring factor EnvC (AmiA/AmiB activator)
MARKKEAVARRAAVACWCGNKSMDPFNEDYGVCRNCGGLVLTRADPPGRDPVVVDDETDFYGKKYWLQHQEGDLGNPDIHARARTDLTERNLHWLSALLRYKLPRGQVIEVGCAHGSLVALMQLAGFQASGSEMSPWVVDFARKTFGVNMHLGPVEELDVAPASLDAILMMDVLEHLPDPVGTLGRCMKLLKKDGVLVIQTPQYREGTTYAQMVEKRDTFLEQLKPEEHLYLFTARGAERMLHDLGAAHVAFEPAIFAHYDMFVMASRSKLARHGDAEVERALLATPGGRIALALLDLRKRETGLLAEMAKARSDIEFLKGRVTTTGEQDSGQLAELRRHFEGAEADRAARGKVIEEQGRTIASLEATAHDHLQEVAALAEQLEATRNERNLVQAQLAEMRGHFEGAEADRAARGRVIEEQGQAIANLQGKIHGHLLELAALSEQHSALSEKHSVLLADQAQIEARMNELRRDYATVVEDRAARSRVVDEHARTISTLQVQIDTRLKELSELRQQVEARLQEIAGLRQQIDQLRDERAELRRQFDLVEADRIARGEVIERQGRRTVELEALVHETEKNRDHHRAEGERLAATLKEREQSLGDEIVGLRRGLAQRDDRIARTEARWWFRLGRKLRLL